MLPSTEQNTSVPGLSRVVTGYLRKPSTMAAVITGSPKQDEAACAPENAPPTIELPDPVEPLPFDNTYPKRKRFRFSETYDLLLLRAVCGADAHIPDRGMAETLYQDVLKTFMKQIPTAVFNHLHKSSGKTLWDRFKRIVSHRRASVKRTAAASGIIERHGGKEQLPDDLIMEVDEKEEAARAEKHEQNLHEKRLVAAGESIRGMALKR